MTSATLLLHWYDRHRRLLPWRALPGEMADPYRVWLSEIMLQQTTVQAVKPYFETFTRLWPTLPALAAAADEDVMKAWAGLGYYSRARNLLLCARLVAEQHGGVFPAEEKLLLQLPGIGSYTAAAIRSIAFGLRAVVVDGNVERVITRLNRLETPLPAAKPAIRDLADGITPADRAGDFAQAMMDLGATICTPKKPACAICPLMTICSARQADDAERFPVKPAKAAKRFRSGAAFVLLAEGSILLRKRPPRGLLGGMTETPGTDWKTGEETPVEPIGAPLQAMWRQAGSIRHVFTHFELELAVFVAEMAKKPAVDGFWVPLADVHREALPTVFRKVIAAAFPA